MRSVFLCILVLLFLELPAQHKGAEKKGFCGAKLNSKGAIQSILKENLEFFRISHNDTIADIGAASGWMEGALSVISPARNVSFYLVDIDTGCLNQRMVNNMRAHYEALSDSPFTNRFVLVNNTPDSLFLPHNFLPKLWIINTLHEVPDPMKMVKAIASVVRTGGEVFVLEVPRMREGQVHGGCKLPLLTRDEIMALFAAGGFAYQEEKVVHKRKRFDVLMQRYVKTDQVKESNPSLR